MTDVNWTTKNPPIADSDIRNEMFRRVFDTIARAIIPFFDIPHAYYGDLLWDTDTALRLPVGDTVFLIARSMGTTICFPKDQSFDSIAVCYAEARAGADSCAWRNHPAGVFAIKRDENNCISVTHCVTRNFGDAA